MTHAGTTWLYCSYQQQSYQWQEDSYSTPIMNAIKAAVAFPLFIASVCTLHKAALPSLLFLELNYDGICCPTPPFPPEGGQHPHHIKPLCLRS